MAKDETRIETFPFGIASAGLSEVKREVPADEPPPLPVNAELSVIGKPVPRISARAKVTGATRYTVDISLPGMLVCPNFAVASSPRRGRAPWTQLRPSASGRARLLIAPLRSPAAVMRYVGAPVAAVAATSMAAAAEAAAASSASTTSRCPSSRIWIRRGRRTRPRSSTPQPRPRPLRPSPGGLAAQWQCSRPSIARRGDAAQGFSQAEIVVEGEYRTHVQTHCCAEPHGIVADWRSDGLDRLHVDAIHRRRARMSWPRPSACRCTACA